MSDTQHDPLAARRVERLDVEDDDRRQQRFHDIFMQLDSKHTPSQDAPRTFDFGDRSTFAVVPPSELLSRVQAFLPQIAASNADIARRAGEDPDSVDMEKLGAENHYIQMNLGLGVFEQRKGASRSYSTDSDAEMRDGERSAPSSYSGSSSSTRSESEETDDSDSDSDDSVDIISSTFAEIASRPIRPLPRRRQTRPHIVILGEEDHSASKRDSGLYSAGESQ